MRTPRTITCIAILFCSLAIAQTGRDAYKMAKKNFAMYNLDQDTVKLVDAKNAIDLAVLDLEQAGDPDVWILKGNIYGKISSFNIITKQSDIGEILVVPGLDDPANQAYRAYKRAHGMAEKKFQTNHAIRGVMEMQTQLYNEGVYAYADNKYSLSFDNFNAVINSHEFLKANGEESSMDRREDYDGLLYTTGLAGLSASRSAETLKIFMDLYDRNYDQPTVYEALYKLTANKDMAAAYAYLEKGRTLFPEDVTLLFAEINHFLKTGQTKELVDRLNKAIVKEPKNVSLISTLANVYDNLYQQEMGAGNEGAAAGYYIEAVNTYNRALNMDAKNYESLYGLGALYYNKAAMETKQLMALGEDLSQAGIKKYDAKHKEVKDFMKQALPYFQSAEAAAPNDISTLIALKEIYAQIDDLAMSKEFNNRLKVVQNGGSNSPYFSN